MRRFLWPTIVLALVIAYPLLFTTPFQQRLGALILLYAIIASAWNIVGGYAGQVSVGHVVFFGCGAYAAMGAYAHFALSPLLGIPAGIVVSVLIAAVIGVPDTRRGEQPLAFVSANEGTTLDDKAIQQFVREKLADYKVPKRVMVLPALPRNATGKVLKTALREMARKGD